jgi:heme oxygenase
MARLKAETQDLHTAAERHPFQAAMAAGRVSREEYVRWLGQMLLVHRRLEARIREAMDAVPALRAVVRPFQFQEPYLLEDLALFGVRPEELTPTPAAAAILADLDRAAASRPLALLGFHYVLEGSNNGSRFIARSIRRALGLTPGRGDRFLDPYGESQRDNWAAFKRDMEAQRFSTGDIDFLVSAAREMFAAISRLSGDVAASPVAPA